MSIMVKGGVLQFQSGQLLTTCCCKHYHATYAKNCELGKWQRTALENISCDDGLSDYYSLVHQTPPAGSEGVWPPGCTMHYWSPIAGCTIPSAPVEIWDMDVNDRACCCWPCASCDSLPTTLTAAVTFNGYSSGGCTIPSGVFTATIDYQWDEEEQQFCYYYGYGSAVDGAGLPIGYGGSMRVRPLYETEDPWCLKDENTWELYWTLALYKNGDYYAGIAASLSLDDSLQCIPKGTNGGNWAVWRDPGVDWCTGDIFNSYTSSVA